MHGSFLRTRRPPITEIVNRVARTQGQNDETPEDTITNCSFGGEDLRTLYVTCGSLLLSIRTIIPGKAAYRPNV